MEETDAWISYQIDRAVTVFGIIVDNALLERMEIGTEGDTVQRYTLNQLLDPEFYLPRPDIETEPFEMTQGMMFDSV